MLVVVLLMMVSFFYYYKGIKRIVDTSSVAPKSSVNIPTAIPTATNVQRTGYPDGRIEYGGYISEYVPKKNIIINSQGVLINLLLSPETRWQKAKYVFDGSVNNNEPIDLANDPESIQSDMVIVARTFSNDIKSAQLIVLYLNENQYGSYK